MNIVLVQNELTAGGHYDHWKDTEGVLYQFPNQYKNRIVEGSNFIYYRGVRRATGKRAIPEYFGYGKIGRVFLDPDTDQNKPKSSWTWFCEILDYIPFKNPVPFKINDIYFESIPQNFWSVAGRVLTDEEYKNILKSAKINVVSNLEEKSSSPQLIEIDLVTPEFIVNDDLLIFQTKRISTESSKSGNSDSRRSKFSKLYGDRAEEIIHRYLKDKQVDRLSWVAKEGKKPGWDIEYYEGGQRISIEVKGTSGKFFLNVEITASEWMAALTNHDNYCLYLVADCLSKVPKIQCIRNPAKLYRENKIALEALVWKMTINEPLSL